MRTRTQHVVRDAHSGFCRSHFPGNAGGAPLKETRIPQAYERWTRGSEQELEGLICARRPRGFQILELSMQESFLQSVFESRISRPSPLTVGHV